MGTTTPLSQLIENGSILVQEFRGLDKEDTGTYRCSVHNGVGESRVTKNIYLNVTCKFYFILLSNLRLI